MMKEIAPGVHLVGRFGGGDGALPCATWVYEHSRRAAVVEMPETHLHERAPEKVVEEELAKHGLTADFLLCSHSHLLHGARIPQYRRLFPDARFVLHESFLAEDHGWPRDFFDETFRDNVHLLFLGGEPLYIIRAPVHSRSDQVLIFRGSMNVGDWCLDGRMDEKAEVSPAQGAVTLREVDQFLRAIGYRVHILFDAHASQILYNVKLSAKFEALAKEMEARAGDGWLDPDYHLVD